VNGIPGYFALWLTSLASLYNHSGDLDFLRSQHDALLRVLAAMDASLDRSGAFTNRKGQWLFVDWAPDLYGYTPRAILGTSLQYLRGYRAAARVLTAIGRRKPDRTRSDLPLTIRRNRLALPVAVPHTQLRNHLRSAIAPFELRVSPLSLLHVVHPVAGKSQVAESKSGSILHWRPTRRNNAGVRR
jgi:hypothetical protein